VIAEPDNLGFDLTVGAPPVVGGQAPEDFEASFSGVVRVPRFFLQAASNIVPGGITQAVIDEVAATVQVRSGATGPDVELGADATAITPGPNFFCLFPSDQVCDPANDVDPDDPSAGNTDCLDGAVPCARPAVTVIDLPISTDCSVGGTCDLLGENTSCDLANFCIASDLEIPLAEETATFTPDASGVVLFGWADQGVPGLSLCPGADCQEAFEAEGSYSLPAAVYSDPVAPTGVRINATGLFLPFQCAIAEPGGICAGQPEIACLRPEDCGGSGPCDFSVAGVSMPTPDSSLIFVGIDEPDPVTCGAADCNDGSPCTADSCGAGDTCVNAPVADGSPCISVEGPGICVTGACVPVCSAINCADDNEECTTDGCDPSNGRCTSTPVPNDTPCDFSGDPGVCINGECRGACEFLDCDDLNECTIDDCIVSTGACSNVSVTDGTSCDFGGLPGVCMSGVCEDAMLCAGVDCDDGNVCTDDSCDPQTGLCINTPVTVTTSCDFLGLPGLCSGDTCVSACELTDCSDGDACTDDVCDPNTATCSNPPSADGSVCDAGFGACQAGVCQPVSPTFTAKTTTLEFGCSNGPTPIAPIPFALTVETTPIIGGSAPREFTARFRGSAAFPVEVLDSVQSEPGGVQAVAIDKLNATVWIDQGTQGPPISLGIDNSQLSPVPTRFCSFPPNQACTADGECSSGTCNPPIDAYPIPTSSDCAAGGTCEALGKTGSGSQCERNGFCVTGSLPLPLGVETRTHVPAENGVVVFRWNLFSRFFQFLVGGPGASGEVVTCLTVQPKDSAMPFFPIEDGAVICGGTDCSDGNTCTIDVCGLPSQTCESTSAGLDTLCDLGELPGRCSSTGTCIPVCTTIICDPDTPCTTSACNPNNGLCETTTLDGTSCDAGGDAGVCVGPVCEAVCDTDACDDGNECTTDSCDRPTGACTNTVSPDGAACDFGGLPGVCNGGVCEDAMLCSGVNCDDGNVCTDDAYDPQTGLCSNDPVQGNVMCDFGGLPGACIDGECRSQCETFSCDDDNDCTNDFCDELTLQCFYGTVADGELCDSGLGRCSSGTCDPIPAGEFTTKSQVVTVACSNSVTTEQWELPFELTVRSTEINGTMPFGAELSGTAIFPEFFLDATQGAVPGGISTAIIDTVAATVQVRSGATGPLVELNPDPSALTPGEQKFCNFPPDQVCATDTECLGQVCLPPVLLVDLPTSTDCAPGGLCRTLGKDLQCDLNGFCISGDLPIPLAPKAQIYTADASGQVLFGWADQGVPGLVTCPAPAPDCTESFMPDGCYDLPSAVYAEPAAPVGMRVNLSGLFVPLQCAGATAGGICDSGEGCIVDSDCATPPCTPTEDVVCPTQDAGLIAFPIN